MQLCQQQRAVRGVRRGAPARTRLAKGTRGSSPHKAYTPDQLFVHALRGGDGPCDARTLVSVIAAPRVGRGAKGSASPFATISVSLLSPPPAACRCEKGVF